MMARRFRILVVVWAVLYVWMFSLPSSAFKQPPEVQEALAYSARGAVIRPSTTTAYLILGVFLATAIGLLDWQSWARKLLVALMVFFVVLRGLRGIAVVTPFSAALSLTFTLLTGMIAALVYTAPLASRFAATGSDESLEDDGDGERSEARHEKLIAVCEIDDVADVREICALLRSTGVNFITSDDGLGGQFDAGQSGGVGGTVGPVRFLVRPEDADATRAVLSVFRLSGTRG